MILHCIQAAIMLVLYYLSCIILVVHLAYGEPLETTTSFLQSHDTQETGSTAASAELKESTPAAVSTSTAAPCDKETTENEEPSFELPAGQPLVAVKPKIAHAGVLTGLNNKMRYHYLNDVHMISSSNAMMPRKMDAQVISGNDAKLDIHTGMMIKRQGHGKTIYCTSCSQVFNTHIEPDIENHIAKLKKVVSINGRPHMHHGMMMHHRRRHGGRFEYGQREEMLRRMMDAFMRMEQSGEGFNYGQRERYGGHYGF